MARIATNPKTPPTTVYKNNWYAMMHTHTTQIEIASQVDRENAVFLFNSSGDPTLMWEGNDISAVYVVMPMRV